MAYGESTLGERAMKAAKHWAIQRFARHRDREELVDDAVSVAWEFSRTAPDGTTPTAIANFAVRYVAVGRQFTQSVRSVTHPAPRPGKPQAAAVDVGELASTRDNPAELAAFRIDAGAWFQSLSDRWRVLALLMVAGYRTNELSDRFGLSPARISQIRAALVADYRQKHLTE